MLLSDFKSLGPISIHIPPTVALSEFVHADTVASFHPLPVSWYLISSLCAYLCSRIHIISILCSTADAVSSGRGPILLKVLTLNVAICIVCLHFRNVWFLSSVADFWNAYARALNSAGRTPFITRAKSDTVYTCGFNVGHGYLSVVVFFFFFFFFILIHRSHSYRWVSVVPPSN